MGRRRWVALVVGGVAACAPFTTGDEGPTTNPTADAGGDASAVPDVVAIDAPRDAAAEGPMVDASDDGGLFVKAPLVFVTSSTTLGDMGGLVTADARCSALAKSAGLPGTKFVAWLSTASTSAANRIIGNGPWHLPKPGGSAGTLVAASHAALISGTLAHAIDVDETGTVVGPALVWTGTKADGSSDATGECTGWMSVTGNGRVGTTASSAITWTFDSTGICMAQYRVYCLEDD